MFAFDKSFQAGRIVLLKLNDLRKDAVAKLATTHPDNGTVSVIEYGGKFGLSAMPEAVRRKLDVGAWQANPVNRGCYSSVASNFNALETLGATDNIDHKMLKYYLTDSTQGPFASISCAPALILRNYYAFCAGDKQNPTVWTPGAAKAPEVLWQQTQERQFNFLAGFGVETKNGYCVEKGTAILQKLQNDASNGGLFTFVLHEGAQVTNGFMHKSDEDGTHERCTDPNQIINQAFVAALQVGDWKLKGGFTLDPASGNPVKDAKYARDGAADEAAKLILRWSYEAIVKAAFVRGGPGKRVLLVRVGGGVFNNHPAWIDRAIGEQADFIKKSGLNVIVSNYAAAEQPSRDRLLELVTKTGGHYIRYKDDGSATEYKKKTDGTIEEVSAKNLPVGF